MPRIINIHGRDIEYDIRGPYVNAPGAEVIRFINPEGEGSEPLHVMVRRMEGESDDDMVARAYNHVRMT